MLTLRTNPMFRDFDALVDALWGTSPFDGAHGLRWLSENQVPTATWSEHDDTLQMRLPLPGLTTDDVFVEVHGRRLTVRAERNVSAPDGYRPLMRERASWTFNRAWDLPDVVDTDSLSAQMRDGVLVISLGRKAKATPRRIAVEQPTLITDKEAS